MGKITMREDKMEQLEKVKEYLRIGWQWAYKLRSVILAVPVVVASIVLAIQNLQRLPVFVGINMQTTGEFAMMIERDVAVFAPLLVTAACLLMMFISRKVLYPWLISIFSLVIPLLLWFTNIFPG